ncbi:unnamed protein product [Absidia cylindrospora]
MIFFYLSREMILFVYGFPTKQSALQFEWAWQHPLRFRVTKRQHIHITSESTLGMRAPAQANLYLSKLRALYDILCTKPFCEWPLKIRFMDPAHQALFLAEGPSPLSYINLPTQLIISHGSPLDILPVLKPQKYLHRDDSAAKWLRDQPPTLECFVCKSTIEKTEMDRYVCCPRNYTKSCNMVSHLTCLATLFLANDTTSSLIPIDHFCPACSEHLVWGDLIYDLRLRSIYDKKVNISAGSDPIKDDDSDSIEDDDNSLNVDYGSGTDQLDENDHDGEGTDWNGN